MDCISAISTASGTGGVAIIRISGDNALDIAKKMFEPTRRDCPYIPNYMYSGNILGDGFSDYGFLVWFRAPKSFTGEDIVEFHCHGGVMLARGILKKTLLCGARLAEKGEFTRRAFLNGKLSLASAEGMADMINAESLALLRAGRMMYTERLTGDVKKAQDTLTELIASVAVEIDYPEEDESGLDFEKIKSQISALRAELLRLLQSYGKGKKIKSGVKVAIFGKPNTGKSSLLNALLGYDKAIVSDEAGTTRDAVEGETEIGDVRYSFFDTAGIREVAGKVESMGIDRAKNIVLSADIALSVSDGGGEAEIPVGFSGERVRVFNKSDIKKPCGDYDIAVSAKTGENVEKLKKLLAERAVGELGYDKAFIVEERHYDALSRAERALCECEKGLKNLTADLVAVDLRQAWDALGEITGESATEEIISAVFSKFCVGK